MKVISGITNFPKFKNTIVAIGIFDGVHLAHQKIISRVVKQAKIINATSVILTFWPHPNKIIHKKNIPLLSSLEHRIKLIEVLGPDYCLILKFTPAFSKIPMQTFIKKILVDKLNAKYIFIGKDFKFGRNKRGAIQNLVKLGKVYGFRVNSIRPIKLKNQKVSSSLIRRLIQKLDLKEARHFLGRDLSLIGKVIHGDKRGKILGFPTANIKPQHEVIPPDGIYAVRIVLGRKEHRGICYIGCVPTFKLKKRIEVHLFNFNKNIYHKFIEIKFISYIRKDKRFPNEQKLIQQIKEDAWRAKRILGRE